MVVLASSKIIWILISIQKHLTFELKQLERDPKRAGTCRQLLAEVQRHPESQVLWQLCDEVHCGHPQSAFAHPVKRTV